MGFSKAPLRLKGLLACGVCALSAGMIVPSVSAAGPAAPASSSPAAAFRYSAQEPMASPTPPLQPLSLAERLRAVADLQDTLAPNTTGITLDLHGSVMYFRVAGSSVGAALTGLGVQATPEETVLPAIDAGLSEGMAVRLRVLRIENSSTEVVLPRPVREVPDASLDAGLSAVDAEGADGLRVVSTETTLEDGQPVSTRTLSDSVARAPVERVVRTGTKALPLPDPAAAATGLHSTFSMSSRNVTAYCLTGRTATGTMAGPGSIAVDPTVIKLGSHLYVPSYGYGWAVDTGGGVHGDAIDLWMTCDDAIQWGRRAVTIYVLDK